MFIFYPLAFFAPLRIIVAELVLVFFFGGGGGGGGFPLSIFYPLAFLAHYESYNSDGISYVATYSRALLPPHPSSTGAIGPTTLVHECASHRLRHWSGTTDKNGVGIATVGGACFHYSYATIADYCEPGVRLQD